MMLQNKPLLVMSVFGGSDSQKWFNIQREALDDTTENFEHAIYLNNIQEEFQHCTIVGSTASSKDGKTQHFEGLLKLLEYARSGDYRAWLVLDCDCFPITRDWESKLSGRNASIIRVENLDVFPHPSAVYCVDRELDFKISKHRNLAGDEFDELAAVGSFFPLMRTNRVNLHPLRYGIYYDLFYHHCAGTRIFETRSDNYYSGLRYASEHDSELFKGRLNFISKLLCYD
jgi:hypothetical protein